MVDEWIKKLEENKVTVDKKKQEEKIKEKQEELTYIKNAVIEALTEGKTKFIETKNHNVLLFEEYFLIHNYHYGPIVMQSEIEITEEGLIKLDRDLKDNGLEGL